MFVHIKQKPSNNVRSYVGYLPQETLKPMNWLMLHWHGGELMSCFALKDLPLDATQKQGLYPPKGQYGTLAASSIKAGTALLGHGFFVRLEVACTSSDIWCSTGGFGSGFPNYLGFCGFLGRSWHCVVEPWILGRFMVACTSSIFSCSSAF